MRWIFICLLFSITSCKTGPICFITSADIQMHAPRKLLAAHDAERRITALYDAGWDSARGGAYLFYPDDKLKTYTYYQSGKKPVYREEYSENGVMERSEGSPMVDRIITEINLDSAYVQIYFFRLQKTFQNLKITINRNPPMQFPLVDDSVNANIKEVSFGLNTKDMTNLDIYSRVEYLDDCSKIDHVLSDTLLLVKNPHISPANPGK
ncbi:MAG: hypothetical protein Q8926_13320 [Bacteroidota bacterium]|nr:hypothetical protein [Bacteroidota bacterium]